MKNINNGNRKPNQKNILKGAHVLVVEDRKINQILMMKILDNLGCVGDSAFSGAEGIAKIKQTNYDLVFMDCHMPEMDGFTATEQIREEERGGHRHTTIVALTADCTTDDREKCLSAGMNDYLNKPFRIEQIADMLRKWVAPLREHG